jgi:hypothetical protein
MLPLAVACHAQDTQTMQTVTPPKEKFDIGVAGLYQVTGAANGNFIRDDTTESGGALISFRQPWRPWAGYEVNVGYTKFYESYNKNVVKVESNVTDFSVSYLLQSPAAGVHLQPGPQLSVVQTNRSTGRVARLKIQDA